MDSTYMYRVMYEPIPWRASIGMLGNDANNGPREINLGLLSYQMKGPHVPREVFGTGGSRTLPIFIGQLVSSRTRFIELEPVVSLVVIVILASFLAMRPITAPSI